AGTVGELDAGLETIGIEADSEGPGGDDGGQEAGGDGADGAGPCPGGAVRFDGVNDVLAVPRPVQDDFTIEAWIRTATQSLTGTRFFDGNGLFYADVMGRANDLGVAVVNNHIIFGVADVASVQSTSS